MGEAESGWDPMIEAYQSPEFNLYGPKFPSKQSGEENLCLFVSGFPSTVTSNAVRNLLSEAGQIQYVKTVPDRKRWNCIIAYVYAATYKDALAIIGGFNNFSFLHSTLRIGFTTRRKPLTDPASQSNVGSVVEARGSLSGLNQTLSDVESLGARLGKADVMDFQRLGPQQKPPMGRAKLLMNLTSDEVKTTVGHGVGRKNYSQPFAATADRCSSLTDEMDDAADCDDVELQNKYCGMPSSAVRQKDEDGKTKTKGLQSVSSSGLKQNEHQIDNAFASGHSSVSSVKKCPDLCAFCQKPGQLFCSICKTTYCSQSCQRNDWPHHKNVCQSKPLKSDSVVNFADFDNEFAVGVDVDELSASLEISLPDGKKFATTSANMKLMESSLPVDEFSEVVLATAPVSPSEIWVVEKKNSQLMDSIKKSLEKRSSGLQDAERSTVQLMLNDYCMCLFSVDGGWYRTRIESVNRDGTFDVRYIDYGNMETVPLSRIDVLEEQFSSVPSLAVRCRLADLVPADGSGVWSKRALKLCSEFLPVLQVFKVKCIQKTANIHSIILVDSAGRSVSDAFIEAGVAKHLSNSTKFALDQSNRENAQEERISPATSKEDQRPGISLSPLSLSPSGSEVVKEIVVNYPHAMPTAAKHLFRGAKVFVKVLNIVSPTQFWVHLLSGSSDMEQLPELEASMKEHYEKKPSQKGFSLTVRMLYAAKCSRSDRWLRVHVLNFDRSGVDAFLLDYGVCQAMSLVGLFSLEGQFLSLPFQAVHCTLAGIRPKAGSSAWTQGTANYFQRLISQTTKAEQLEAAVCQMDGSCVHLELMLPCGETVNDLLVKYGMAEFVPDLEPGFFVLSRNLISGGKTISEGKTSTISPLNLQMSPTDQSSGELVEGLLKRLETPAVHVSTSSAAPKLKDLMRNPLVTDKIHEVIVTDATHFFGFYVQVVTIEKATMLQSLEERLNEIYCDYRGSFHPCVGDIVAARFSVDQKWYRGLVREVRPPDSALVMFLDYGNCDSVKVKFISPLDASLLTIPVFAYRCTLLEPTGVVFVHPWNPDFLLPLSATFQMKVLKEKENVHVVDLFSKDHNISWKVKLLRDGVIQLKPTSTVDLSKPQSLSSPSPISSSLGDKVAGSVAGNRPKFEVSSAVCVVHINSVADFYVHVEDEALDKAFRGLMQRLKDECDKCALSSYVPNGPGEVVAAFFDHIWYRAKVLQIMSPTACRMEFVDFGNVDVVACSCLRPLPLGCQLDDLSEMAVPCCLFDVCTSPKGGSGDCLDAESAKWFRNLCLEKQFTVSGMCNFVSNRYAIDLRSKEMISTVRECYLKMSSDQRVPPVAENVATGKPLADKCLVPQLACSSSGHQEPSTPLASFTQRPSDKRVHFANDVKCYPRAQSSVNQLRPTGNMQSGFRSPANSQSGYRSTTNNQSGPRSTTNNQSGPRSTGSHQLGHRPTGSNWPGQDSHMINGTAPRSIQNNQPQFAESKQPDSKVRENNHSGPKVTESRQAGPVITEKKHSGSEVSESQENLSNKPLTQQSTTAKGLLLPLGTAVTVEGSDHSADDRSCVVTEKSKNLQASERSDEVVMSKSSPCQRLPVVDQSVSIVHINSPSDFYIQLFDDESKEQMAKFLAEFHQSALALNATPYSNGRVGDSVAGLFDNCWFRAEVVELLPGNRARLFFVDYGNICVVEYRNIRSTMPKALLSRPWLAVHCAIEGVVGNEANGEWGKDAIEWFRQRFENELCMVKVVNPLEGNQPCMVDLIGSQAKESIKEQIISNRFGQTVSPKQAEKTSRLLVSSIQTQSSDGVCLTDLKTPKALENLSDKLPKQKSTTLGKAVAVEGSDRTAEDRSHATTEKSKNLQASERSYEVVMSKSSPCQQLPVVDQSVSIVHINSPSDFYIQLFDDESKEQMAKFLAEFHQSALALNATPYSNGRVGDSVAGLFDNCWFRAEVVELLPGDRARLFFVDYGNVSLVEYRNIRSTMPKALLSRPWLAVHCAIEGVMGNEANGEYGKEAIAWFRQRFENEICTVKVVNPLEGKQPCMVDLIGSQAKESIKEQIISNRFGQPVSPKQAEKTSCVLVNSIQTQSSVGVCLTDLKTPESHENLCDKLLLQQSVTTEGPLPPLGKTVAVDGSDRTTDDRTEKSKHLQRSERPDEVIASKYSPCQRLPVVDKSVCIVHVNSPSDFYVQLFDDESKEQMSKFLAEFHQSALSLNTTPYSNGRVRDSVAGLFDNCWFRAEVVELLPGNRARLFFVDYGNVSVIEYRNIRSTMPKALLSRPLLAIHCAIEGVVGNEANGEWCKDAIAWFRQRFENEICTVKAVIPSERNQPCAVDLIGSQAKESVKEQIISNRFGQTVSPKQAEKTSRFLVSSIQTQSSDGVCLTDLKTPKSPENLSDKLPMQKSAYTEGPLLPFGKAVAVEGSDRTADDRSHATTEKSKHLQASVRSDEVVMSKSSPCQRPPVVDQSVSIVHINSPSDFYIQLFDDESKEQMAKFLAEFHQSALALNATPYSNGRVGDSVAGLFDNCWFRAEVVELLPGDRARLFFVDYGNVSVIEYRNIRSTMPKALLSRPLLAIHCAIEGVMGNEANGEYGKDAIAWFRQRFENEICTVKAVIPSEGNQPCAIDLIGSQAKESIKEQIISNRFGQTVSPKHAEKTITLDTEINSTLAIKASNTDEKILGKVVKVNDDVADLPQREILSPPPLPSYANVKVIHANNPLEFFVQSADETVQLSIAQLCMELTTHCCDSTHGSYRPSAVGEYVAGCFEGMWFRAKVLTILPQDQFELFFVDFGNVDIIGASNIRSLPAKFFDIMPKQAISCGLLRLAGTDVGEKWSHDSCAWFKAYCENFDFHVQAVVLDECGKCLIDMVRKGDQHSIREQLLSSHQAVDVTSQAKLLCDSDHNRNKETSTLTTSLSHATVIPEQGETQRTTASKPIRDTNTRDLRSVAQESSQNLVTSVTDQPTSAANLVSSANNRPTASTDPIKAPFNNSESSVDTSKMAAVKPGSCTINCGDVVTIVHVNSPSDFYVQLQTDSLRRELVELLKKLNEWCTSSASGAKPYRPTGVGEIVAANFEGIWYRAEVLDICNDSKFKLRFIDYGNVDVTDFGDIRCLPVALINALPRQAIPCAISGVMPVEPNGCWSPEALSWFRENTENVSSFVVRSSSLTHEGKYSIDVHTVLPNGNQELSLCEMLISLKFGRSSETSASRNSQSNLISNIKSNEHSVVAQSCTQSVAQSNDQSVVAQSRTQSTAQSSDQSGCLSIITQSNARSSGQSSRQLSDETVPKDSVDDRIQRETGCSRSVFKMSDLPELRLSSDVTVEVTLPTNPGSFWCQDLIQMADMIKRFQFQESPPLASASSSHPKAEKNEVCLGFHDKYGEWYRVVVKDVLEDRLTVRFMDYGDEATLPFHHVRPLPAELINFPPLAFHCSLTGVIAVGSGWTEQAKAVFHSLVTSQILTASIQGHDSKTDDYKVILKVQSSGQLVGDELVMAGLAKRV